jgi:putative ABC transport system permease protein
MHYLPLDLRLALRTFARNRSFAGTAIAALALGIGATSAIFSVIYGVLLKPLPYRNPGNLVRVYAQISAERLDAFPLSPADFRDYRRQNHVFESMAAYIRQDQQYGGEHPQRLIGMRVSHGFFHLLGVAPQLGRAFTQEEESNPGPADTVIVSHNVWKRLLGGSPQAIGSTIRLSDSLFRVVGVMPAGFEQLNGGRRVPRGEAVDVWLPFNLLGVPQISRVAHYCQTVARLAPATTIGQAQAEMNAIAAGLEVQYPDDAKWGIQLKPLHDDLVSQARPTLLILAGAVAFVLLIACVNVTNLLLARSAVRQREMAIRAAIGATRARLVRQLLTESVTLAALGGALGLLVAWWGVRTLVALGPEQLPRVQAIGLDVRVVLVTAAASVFCGLLFGLAPALAAGTDRRRGSPRGVFVVAEVALSFVLLTGAGLFMRSFVAIGRIDPGFNPRGVLTMNTALSIPKLVGARRYTAFYESFTEELSRLPGVSAAGAASSLAWTGVNDNTLFGIKGRPGPAGLTLQARSLSVSPDYLRALGVPLLAGRWLTTADHFDAPKVALVNKALALQYWPTVEACVGQQIYTRNPADRDAAMTIVGITGNVKDSPTDVQAPPVIYSPFLQNPSFGNYVVLRAASDPAALAGAVHELARRVGNDFSIQEVRPMEDVVAAAVATERFALQIVGLFAVVALALALIGVYGVISYTVSRRSHEIAIRSAIGASPDDILRLLLGQVAKPILAGLIAGGLASASLTRVLAGMLYQVSAKDPLTFAGVALLLAVGALGACLMPARRALRLDPMAILRSE